MEVPSHQKLMLAAQHLPQHGEEEVGQEDEVEEKGKKLEKEKEEKGKKDRVERANQKAFRFLSVLLQVVMVPVLWCSISHPPLLVWRFSFLLCCNSILWSRRLDVTLSAGTMFLVTLSGLLAALYFDAVLDHEIGVLMAHLNSHFDVGMLGYSLAMHRQHNGLEVTPATATPKKLSKKQNFSIQILGWCCIGMVTVLGAASMVWVFFYRAEYSTEHLVLQAFGPMSFALLLWSLFLGTALLRVVFIGEAMLSLLAGQLLLVEILVLVGYTILGDVGVMLVTWLGFLVWTGCFGYSLCVHNSFKLKVATE